MDKTPLYRQVPKKRSENIRYRIGLSLLALEDPAAQAAIGASCSEDLLFFVNTFCWLYEPRPTPQILPFVTYQYQDDCLLEMDRQFGRRDIGIEKSRDLGATWMLCAIFFHRWLFAPGAALGLMSRNEDVVDKSGDSSTLFWKLDFLYEHLPAWMKPKLTRTHMRFANADNKSVVVGSSTTGDAFRGARNTAIGMDEYAAFPKGGDYEARDATQHATFCRIFVSTPKGPSGAFYDIMHDAKSGMAKIVLDWKDHPDRRRGLYTSDRGKLKILDDKYEFPKGYQFVLDGKRRSPYYDNECNRPGATPQSIAQELDRDYGGSGWQFFDSQLLRRLKDETVMAPFQRGVLGCDRERLEPGWIASSEGPWKLWTTVSADGLPPEGQYVAACDVATGASGDHSSNSVISVFDMITGSQVCEYATSSTFETDFADLAVACCKWFHGARLIWEANGGPGSRFTAEVVRVGYDNVYRRNVEQLGHRKRTKKPGFWSSRVTKEQIFGELHRALASGEIVVRSQELLAECGQYVYKNGRIVHSRAETTEDQSSKGEAHGDRVIAAALAQEAIRDAPPGKKAPEKPAIPEGSPAWRMMRYIQEEEKAAEESESYCW